MDRAVLDKHITDTYGAVAEYMWEKYPTFAVYRHENNKKWFAESKDNNIVYTSHNDKENKDVYMVALRDDNGTLIGYYEKHEYRNQETAELYKMEK